MKVAKRYKKMIKISLEDGELENDEVSIPQGSQKRRFTGRSHG